MQLIGKGSFSRVYLADENTVKITTIDPVKYCLAEMGMEHRLLPKLWKDKEFHIFGKKYDKVKSPRRELCKQDYMYYRYLTRTPCIHTYRKIYEEFDKIPFEELKDAIFELLDSVCNYIVCNSLSFEISRRNVMRDGDKLILNDVFFNYEYIKGRREEI